MNTGALAHQEGFKKHTAPESLYRDESLYCNGDGSKCCASDKPGHTQSHDPESCFSAMRMVNQDVRELIESQAKALIVAKAQLGSLKRFLEQVPWATIDRHSKDRSVVSLETPTGGSLSPAYVVFGMYMHGGIVGVTKVSRRFPWLTRVLGEVIRQCDPGIQVTSIGVSCNCKAKAHRDKYNTSSSSNLVIPIVQPQQGGEVWVEGSGEAGSRMIRECEGKEVQGRLVVLNQPQKLDPRKWHETMPWTGDRLIVIGYALSTFRKLPRPEIMWLKRHGVPFPWRSPKTIPSNRGSPQQCLKLEPTPAALLPNGDHAQHHHDQERDATEVGLTGGSTPGQLDQGPTFSKDLGAHPGSGGDPHRARGCEDDQSVQDETCAAGVVDRAWLGVHPLPDSGPAAGSDAEVPDGEQSSSRSLELHGVRQTQQPQLRAGDHSLPKLCDVVCGHSVDRERVPLETSTLCSMGPGLEQNGEGSDRAEPRQRTGECTTCVAPNSTGCPEGLSPEGARQCIVQRDDGTQMGADVRPARREPRPGDDPGWVDQFSSETRRDGGGDPATQGDGEEQHELREGHDQEAAQGRGEVDPEGDLSMSDLLETDEEDLAPAECRPLSFRVAKGISSEYERALLHCVESLGPSKVRMIEVGGSGESLLKRAGDKVFGEGSVLQLSQWNGGDLGTEAGREYVLKTIQEVQPRCVWFSPDCSVYSPMQRCNRRSPEQVARLQAKREAVDREYEGVSQVLRAVASQGITCVLALVEQCEAWQQPWMSRLQGEVQLYQGSCDGCQVNLRDFQGCLVCRRWNILSTDGALVQHMSLVCDGRHARSRKKGHDGLKMSSYTQEFCKRVMRYVQRLEDWFQVAREVQGAGQECYAADEAPGSGPPEADPAGIQDIPAETRRKIFQNLRRIHTATGHCSVQYLKASLKKRGASKEVLRCVDHFSCDVCKERRRMDPRSSSTLVEIAPKWHTLQCDAFAWNHPESGEKWQCLLGIDEGSRLRVGRVLFQHASRTPSMQDFVDFFEGHWLPSFGKPQVLRVDPAGCFRSKHLDEYLADRQIEVQHIPAEAHWQISVVERAIQSLKAMMSALVSEQPSMSATEAFARSIWASNNRDQYHGYSPLQHAFGRSPNELGQLGESKLRDLPVLSENGVSAEFGVDVKAMFVAEKAFLEEQAKERLRRAELSGARTMKHFCPGDLVYAWRRMTPKADGNKHFKGGRFVGPYRVLGTETRVEESGELRPGHVVWLYRGGQLVKASPQQLLPATAREESWNELNNQGAIPWTVSDTLKANPPHQFEDISKDSEAMPAPASELVQDEERREREEPPRERTPRRMIGKQAPRMGGDPEHDGHREEQRVRSRSPPQREAAVPRGRKPPMQDRAEYMEDCGLVVQEKENPYWNTEGAAVELDLELPPVKSRRGKEWTRDLGCFFTRQLRRQAVEISERHLSEAEREGFRRAKQKEVKNFVVAKAFQALPEGMKPSKSQILKMRWILTWKLDENPEGAPLKRDPQGNPLKPKARAVVLGYMDPLYEHRPTSSPTMSRTTRQLFLQSCANKGFSVEKGDISGAFLQGDEFGSDRMMACEPLPEICAALGVPAQSTMLLTKAAYGLVEAPIQWFLSISRFLESIGAEQQLSDPCCWSFFKKELDAQGRRICIGHVCGHVDDFLFGGRSSCPEWQAIKAKIQERFKWGQWEVGKFTQCGVLIEQDENGFALSQPDYLDSVTEIHLSRARWNELEAPINNAELHQLRSVLGALSWHATQVAPQWSAPVSLLPTKIHQGTVNEIVETNKLLRKAKLGQHQKLLIHRQDGTFPMIAAWADAANSNRQDGGSTKGIFVGWTSEALLQGNLASISPIFWQSAKIQRACRSSAAAETHAAVDAEDELYAIRLQVGEFLGERVKLWSCDESVKMVPGVLVTDSKNVYDRLNRTVMTFRGAEKRADIETLCLKESMNATGLLIR